MTAVIYVVGITVGIALYILGSKRGDKEHGKGGCLIILGVVLVLMFVLGTIAQIIAAFVT